METIINQWVDFNTKYFKDRRIQVETNLYYDQGTQKTYIFSKEDKVAGIYLFIDDDQGILIISGNQSELIFEENDKLPEVFRKIIEHLETY